MPPAARTPAVLRLAVLASGSSGNAAWIGDGRHGVLVDCGISTRQLLVRMAGLGLADAPIDAVLVTHEHSDHVGGAAVLARRLARDRRPVPFFMTPGTRDRIPPRRRPDGVETVPAGSSIRVGSLVVESFPVPHDAGDPVMWRVGLEGTWVGVVTDLGRPTATVRQRFGELSAAVLEFNHDREMLLTGPYPPPLKERIRSGRGHLSNDQAARLLLDGLGPRLRHLLLGHLSEENNRPDVAMAAAAAALREAGALGRVRLGLARQDRPAPLVEVRAGGDA